MSKIKTLATNVLKLVMLIKKNSLIIVIINMTKDQNLSMCTTNRVEIGYI